MGPRQQPSRCASGRPGLRHALSRSQPAGLGQRLPGVPLVPDLVEPGREPLGEATGVGEDDGRVVRLDEVGHPLLDVRPDARPLRLVSLAVGGRRPAQLGEVLHGHDDLQVEALLARRCHDVDRSSAGEEAGHLVGRADGGGQPDPLRRLRE